MTGALSYREAPGAVLDDQVRRFREKVNVPSRRWDDIWREQHNAAFIVAGAHNADLLDDLRRAVDGAIARGETLEDFRRNFDRIVQRFGWQYNGTRGWRSRLIWETNIRQSHAAGRYRQMTRPEALRLRPFWRYRHNDSVRFPRIVHQSWDGLVLNADDPWWQRHHPPGGFGCKCFVEPLNRRQMARLGKFTADDAPPVRMVEHTRKATGETVMVPEGIDPGFDYVPGQGGVAPASGASGQGGAAPGRMVEAVAQQAAQKITPAAPSGGKFVSNGIDWGTKVKGQPYDALNTDTPQLAALQAWLGENPVASLTPAPSQHQKTRRRGVRNRDVTEESLKAAGIDGRTAFNVVIGPSSREAAGYTSRHWPTPAVVSYSKSGTDFRVTAERRAEVMDELRAAAREVIQQRRSSEVVPPFALAARERYSLADSAYTWLHELGHQVHFIARDTGRPPMSNWRDRSVSRYGRVNEREWHAEHFVLWVLVRDDLMRWDPQTVRYFDEIFEDFTP